MKAAPRRRRLAPEDRISEILDAAERLAWWEKSYGLTP